MDCVDRRWTTHLFSGDNPGESLRSEADKQVVVESGQADGDRIGTYNRTG